MCILLDQLGPLVQKFWIPCLLLSCSIYLLRLHVSVHGINFWILTLIGPCTTASNIFPSCDVALALCIPGPYVQYSLVFYFSVKDGTCLWAFAHSFFFSLAHFVEEHQDPLHAPND
ncbi:hypothetical protein VPH35_073073 [Triticum aestivum]